MRAKLIDEFKQIGGKLNEEENGDEGGDGDADSGNGTAVQPYYPPGFYSNAGDQNSFVIKEDKAIRRKKKQILDSFNQRRLELKQRMDSKPPLPMRQARLAVEAEKRITSTMNSSSDDGFRNYEENKTRLEAQEQKNAEAVTGNAAEYEAQRDANLVAVVRS